MDNPTRTRKKFRPVGRRKSIHKSRSVLTAADRVTRARFASDPKLSGRQERDLRWRQNLVARFLRQGFSGSRKRLDQGYQVRKLSELEKYEKNGETEKTKNWKSVKSSKPEINELKAEKLERDGYSSRYPWSDPLVQQVIQALAGLTEQVVNSPIRFKNRRSRSRTKV